MTPLEPPLKALDIEGILGPMTPKQVARKIAPDVKEWRRRMASPASLGEWASGGTWRRAKHLDFIDEQIKRCAREDLRLIISTPPQMGKSRLVSQWLPVWYLARFPERPIIHVSYGGEFAVENGSERVRDRIQEIGPELGIAIEGGARSPRSGWKTRYIDPATGQWKRSHEGGMHSVGIGGQITGFPAKLIIADDLLKDSEEALSTRVKRAHREWWESTLSSRIRPGTSAIVIATRWAEDDIPGYLIEKSKRGGDKWEVISLPALAYGDDPLGREPGEALWPEVVSREWLENYRAGSAPYWWSALYQCAPRAPDGQVFRRPSFRYCEVLGDFVLMGDQKWNIRSELRYAMAIDTALKLDERNDYTVIVVFAITPRGDIIVWDVDRQRLEVPDQWAAIRTAIQKFRPARVGIEDKASGTGLLQQAKREGFRIEAIKANADKGLRATPLSIGYQMGRVWHRSGTKWLDDLEYELLGFPSGAHDDQVDALAHCYGLAVTLAARPPVNLDDYVVGGSRRKAP